MSREKILLDFVSVSLSINKEEKGYIHPKESVRVWYREYQNSPSFNLETNDKWAVKNFQEFRSLLSNGIFAGMSPKTSDALLATALNKIADFTPEGNPLKCSFIDILSPILFAAHSICSQSSNITNLSYTSNPGVNQAAAEAFSKFGPTLPPVKAILARVAMVRFPFQNNFFLGFSTEYIT